MPRCWLVKSDPDEYGYDDLERDGKTVWDGVTNNLALKHLREIRKGDRLIIYHTGKEKAIVGLAEAASDPFPDPRSRNQRLTVIEIKSKKRARTPVTLAEIKQMPEFASFPLVRMPRLSVMPADEKECGRLLELAGL